MIFTQTAFKARISGLETENADLTAQLATANLRLEELSGANERIAELETELTSAQESTTAAAAQITALETAAADHAAALEAAKASAAAKAVEICASAGIETPLEIEGGTNTPEVKTMTRAEFTSMKPGDSMAFIKSGGKLTD